MSKTVSFFRRLTPFQIITSGFLFVIFLGSILLYLPVSRAGAAPCSYLDALFTSGSAVCVTGLVVQNTGTYWSAFGKTVIMLLIQIGGLGVITVLITASLVSGRKIGLRTRDLMQNAIGAPHLSGIIRFTRFLILFTLLVELTGACFLAPGFIRQYGFGNGTAKALFHSISAFCNAGFDLMGRPGQKFASMTYYSSHPLINIVLMLLIIVGGIGFLTWKDVVTYKFRFKRYRLQSKVILITSAVLIAVPAVIFFLYDFAQLPLGERILGSLFQSVTTRTAGFNTLDLTSMTSIGQAIFIVLMLIGGSPGSTAGGMKTTTIAVLVANAVSIFRRKDDPECFGRRIDAGVVKVASTVFLMYITLCFAGAAVICAVEKLPAGVCLFETASAVGTVGLTLGITPQLGLISHIILILLMFLGRVGGLTVIYAAVTGSGDKMSKLPAEQITVG